MQFSSVAAGLLLSVCALAAPFEFPLANGFPNPSQAQVSAIQKTAGGTLPDGPPPSSISQAGITNLKLIALNEQFEVAFFTELLNNITNNVHGYSLDKNFDKSSIESYLKAVIAQEELHALNANGALQHFKVDPIQPCKYNFPVTTVKDAIALASKFTDLVLGTLQDANTGFAENGDTALIQGVSSVIGQEGEQNGFYRLFQYKFPSAAPFLTTGAPDFAFTAIQSFVVPGSCPNINTIPLKTFAPLNLLEKSVEAKNSTLHFSWAEGQSPTHITYISGQNTPVSVPFTQESAKDGQVVVRAEFPFDSGFSNGLTIAAATTGSGQFSTADDVAKATVFGPALIEVD